MHNDNASATGPDKSRRAFLILVPLGLLAGVFTSVATAAYRFLKPGISESSNKWIDVAPLADLTGNLPLPKKIVAEQIAGDDDVELLGFAHELHRRVVDIHM